MDSLAGILGGGGSVSSGSAGLGNILGALSGGKGGNIEQSATNLGGSQDMAQLFNFIQNNPQLLQQQQELIKGFGKGVKGILNRILPEDKEKKQNQMLEMQRLINEQERLKNERQRLGIGRKGNGKDNCSKCLMLRQKSNLTEREKMEMEELCRACEEVCIMMDQMGLDDMTLQQLCINISKMNRM
jgi:hypothetical protein